MNNILVTSVGGNGVGNQIVNALRLDDSNFIIGTDIRILNQSEIDNLNIFFVSPTANSNDYLTFIDNLIDSHNIKIVFFSSLSEAKFYYSNIDYFKKKKVFVVLGNKKTFEICNNKNKLFDFLKEKGIPVLKYSLIKDFDDCKNINFFPVIVKQNSSAFSSKNVSFANDMEELQLIIKLFLKRNIIPIVQECKSNYNKEYSVSVTSLEDTTIVGAICLKRNFDSGISIKESFNYQNEKIYISSGISQGTIEKNIDLINQAKTIALALNSDSSLNLQGVWVDNTFWIIDAHPAITSSTFIKSLAGYNDPQFWVDYLLHNKKNNLNYRESIYQKYISIREISNG